VISLQVILAAARRPDNRTVEAGHLRGELYIDRLDGTERSQAMRRLRDQITTRR
jgi:hypothetical protein